LTAHPEGRNVSVGLGAKAESCAGGLPTEDAAKGKTYRVISPENKICADRKQGFLPCLELSALIKKLPVRSLCSWSQW